MATRYPPRQMACAHTLLLLHTHTRVLFTVRCHQDCGVGGAKATYISVQRGRRRRGGDVRWFCWRRAVWLAACLFFARAAVLEGAEGGQGASLLVGAAARGWRRRRRKQVSNKGGTRGGGDERRQEGLKILICFGGRAQAAAGAKQLFACGAQQAGRRKKECEHKHTRKEVWGGGDGGLANSY